MPLGSIKRVWGLPSSALIFFPQKHIIEESMSETPHHSRTHETPPSHMSELIKLCSIPSNSCYFQISTKVYARSRVASNNGISGDVVDVNKDGRIFLLLHTMFQPTDDFACLSKSILHFIRIN